MGRYGLPVTLGVVTGLIAAGGINRGETQDIYDAMRDENNPASQIDVSAPQTQVDHLMAFAVGKISGAVTVEGQYDKTRWGPVPNCSVDISMELPFVAEPIVQMRNLEITPTPPNAAGQFDLHVVVDGRVEVLNPRSKLDAAAVEHSGNSWGQVCDEDNYDNLLNSMFEIGGLATNTSAECLANSVFEQTAVDPNGNVIETEASEAIHGIYEDDLRIALAALYPNSNNITIDWPALDQDYDISRSASYQALTRAVDEFNADDEKYNIDASAVQTCTFQSVTLDVSPVSDEAEG